MEGESCVECQRGEVILRMEEGSSVEAQHCG